MLAIPITLRLEKNRHGATGKKVSLKFHGARSVVPKLHNSEFTKKAAKSGMKNPSHLSLSEIDLFDPQSAGRQRRLCPSCGGDKPKDGAHRSLTLGDNGLWPCHRCKAGGQLREFWTDKSPMTKRERVATQLKRVFAPSAAPLRAPLDPNKATESCKNPYRILVARII